jgi:hypothetical protein
MSKSSLENQLAFQMKAAKLPKFEREFRFAAEFVGLGPGVKRRLFNNGLKDWRFDFFFADHLLAIEVEGGTFNNGRHNRPVGFEEDCIKYGKAMELGYSVYRCTGNMVKNGQALKTIEILLDI